MKSSLFSKKLGYFLILLAFSPFCHAVELVNEGKYVDFSGEERKFQVHKVTRILARKFDESQLVPQLILEAKGGFSLFYPHSYRKITFDANGTRLADRVFNVQKGNYTLSAPNGSFQTLQYEDAGAEGPAQISCLRFYSSDGSLVRKVTKGLGEFWNCEFSNDGRYLFVNYFKSGLSVFDTSDGSLKKSISKFYFVKGCFEGKNECFSFHFPKENHYEIYDKKWNNIAKLIPGDVPVRISEGGLYGWLITTDCAMQWSRGRGIVQKVAWPGVENLIGGEELVRSDIYNGHLLISDVSNVFLANEKTIKPLWQRNMNIERLIDVGNWNNHMAMFISKKHGESSDKADGKLVLLGKEGKEFLIGTFPGRFPNWNFPSRMMCKGDMLVLSLDEYDYVYKISQDVK